MNLALEQFEIMETKMWDEENAGQWIVARKTTNRSNSCGFFLRCMSSAAMSL